MRAISDFGAAQRYARVQHVAWLLTISQGDWMIFVQKPLSLTLLIVALIAVLGPKLWAMRGSGAKTA